MPNRYLRESYIGSESVNALSWQAEVFWTRLLVAVDDWGRCEAHPKLLRAKIFPLRLDAVREADVSRLIAECEKAGLVRLYSDNGKEYLQMFKWEVGRALESKYPDPPGPYLAECYINPRTSVRSRKQARAPANKCPDSESDPDSDPESEPTLAQFLAEIPPGIPHSFASNKYYAKKEKGFPRNWKVSFVPRVVDWFREDALEHPSPQERAPNYETQEDRMLREFREAGQ